MSRALATMLLVVAACASEPAPTTESTPPTTTTAGLTTTTPSMPITTTTAAFVDGPKLIKLDPLTLEPVAGLEAIPLPWDSWNIMSTDGSIMVNFEWSSITESVEATRVIDVARWELLGEFDLETQGSRTIAGDTLYTYDESTGRLNSVNVRTGAESTITTWPTGLWLWDELHVLADGRIAALATTRSNDGDYILIVHDPETGNTVEVPTGTIHRVNEHTGVFDGDYEIPESDSPGVAWREDRVFIVHADEPDVMEVDLATEAVRTHHIDTTTWWSRLVSNWMPTATAKGPSLGTNSSAALSLDGRFLFISGNRHNVEAGADGALVETSEHLGLTVVDTETWDVVESPDIDVQYLRRTGDRILGINTTSLQPWIDEIHLLEVDEFGAVVAADPFVVTGGGCDLAADGQHLLCFEHRPSDVLVQLVDIETRDAVAQTWIGSEDQLHPNGVLEDWPARS